MAVWGVAHQSIAILQVELPSHQFPAGHIHLLDRAEWLPCREELPRPKGSEYVD
jgi:hypothetical protein